VDFIEQFVANRHLRFTAGLTVANETQNNRTTRRKGLKT